MRAYVGLCYWKIILTDVHPILTIMFENILRIFEVEVLKIFKKIQPQLAQKLDFLIKRALVRREVNFA